MTRMNLKSRKPCRVGGQNLADIVPFVRISGLFGGCARFGHNLKTDIAMSRWDAELSRV